MSENEDVDVVQKDNLSADDFKLKNNCKKQKRPDKQLYIPPRCKNTKTTELDTQIHCKQEKSESPNNKEKIEPSWDSLYDENGDVLDNEFVDDLNSELKIKAISEQLASSKLDYSKYCDITVPEEHFEDCGTILEVYDFSSDLKTRDLVTSISATNTKNFDIDWVDDTHALVVFATEGAATEALSKVYPNLKLRPLSLSIKDSRLKAKKKIEAKVPRKPRPETTTLLARRLVAGALGIKADMNPEQRKAEREKLRLAKEKKQQVLKQEKNIWEGNVS